jgi:hypothetical protein
MNYSQHLRKKMQMHENHAILFLKISVWRSGRSAKKFDLNFTLFLHFLFINKFYF